jgi:hypothetical protein
VDKIKNPVILRTLLKIIKEEKEANAFSDGSFSIEVASS